MDYKTPLLPTSEFTREVCCRHRRLSKWAIGISTIALISVFYHNYWSHHTFVEPCITVDSQPPIYDLQSPSVTKICPKPDDTWSTSVFEFTAPKETYTGVAVQQKGGTHLTLTRSEANVVVDSSVTETTIRLEAKYQDKYVADYIGAHTDDRDDDVLHVIFDTQHFPGDEHPCLRLVITVTLPSPSVLESLELGIPNGSINLEDAGIVFSKALSLGVANGKIRTNGVSGGDMSLSVANGKIDGTIGTFSGESLSASCSNGKATVNVATITGPSTITVHVANGNAEAVLPDSFETHFKLSTLIGHLSIDSPNPEKIHYEGGKRFLQRNGYYGNPNDRTANTVSLSTVNGNSSVTFVKQK